MDFTYKKLYLDRQNKLIDENTIIRSDGMFIPNDPNNVQYQEYLDWVAKGNTIGEPD